MAEYIEREALIKALESDFNTDWADYASKDYIDGVRDEYDDVLKIICTIPAADVQPVKREKWESSQRTIETGTVYCSNCAIEYYISDLQTVGDCNGIVHYCPNCGARMDTEPDEPWQSK